jgi:hypothetical protein
VQAWQLALWEESEEMMETAKSEVLPVSLRPHTLVAEGLIH